MTPPMTDLSLAEKVEGLDGPCRDSPPRCVDFDDECVDVPGIAPDGRLRSHLGCWLYDPARGYCPFLRAKGEQND